MDVSKKYPLKDRTQSAVYRSSHQRCSLKISVFKKIVKFPGKHLLIKLKKRLWHRCFSVNFVKILSTTFLQNTSVGCFTLPKKKIKKDVLI